MFFVSFYFYNFLLVPIRREVPNFKEALTSAGVRFVYFSSRNMRRSKPVAEKIGLQFDWNVRTLKLLLKICCVQETILCIIEKKL